jgi:hypothetical protein
VKHDVTNVLHLVAYLLRMNLLCARVWRPANLGLVQRSHFLLRVGLRRALQLSGDAKLADHLGGKEKLRSRKFVIS